MLANRGKPAVAEENRAAADANIQAKLDCMRAILEQGEAASVELLSRLPSTPRQFNFWTAAAGSYGAGLPRVQLKAIAPQTMRKREGQMQQRDSLITALRTLCGVGKLGAREARLANYKARLALSERLRRITEAKIAGLFEENEALRREVHRLRARHSSELNKFNLELEKLQSRLDAEMERAASLAKTLAKTTPLRARK